MKRFKEFFIFLFLVCLFTCAPRAAHAYNILFYYDGCDPLGQGQNLLKAVTILRNAGSTVTVIDVDGGATSGCFTSASPAGVYDPTADNWLAYDQVWDARFIPFNAQFCNSAPFNYTNDYFSAAWQTKTQDYIANNCGNFYLQGENAGFASRNLGDAAFLQTVGAVNGSYVACPTGGTNSNAVGSGGTDASSLPGAASFFGDQIGGIPLADLNGTSYVTDSSFADEPRSVEAGFAGTAQLTNLTGPNVGKLFVGWDTTMFNGSDYAGGNVTVTDAFFTAVANWMGSRVCGNTPTFTPTPTSTATFTATNTPAVTDTFTATATSTFTFTATATATFTNTGTSTFTPTVTLTPTSTNTPTITFTPTNTPTSTPTNLPDTFYVSKNLLNTSTSGASVSIYVSYPYYPGDFDLWIYNSAGEFITSLESSYAVNPIDKSFSWDGTNHYGDKCASGVYILYLVEPSDRKLKRILLIK